MKKSYDTDGFDVYMLLSDVVCQPSYEMEMLQRNHISGILDMRLRYIDGEGYPCYKVSGLTEYAAGMMDMDAAFASMPAQQSSDVLSATISAQPTSDTSYASMSIPPEEIMRLFQAVFHVIWELRRYLLVMNDLVLQEEYIFFDNHKKQFVFTYLPGYQISVRMQMRVLMEQYLGRMDHTNRVQADKVYDLYQKIAEEYVDPEELGAELDRILSCDGSFQMSGIGYAEKKGGGHQIDDVYRNMEAAWNMSREDSESEDQESIEKSSLSDFGSRSGISTRHQWNIYKSLIIGGMILTFLAGVIMAYLQCRRYGRVEHTKPLFGICILLAVELLAYIELDKWTEDNRIYEEYPKEPLQHTAFREQKTEDITDDEIESDVEKLRLFDKSCEICTDENAADTQVLNTGQPYGMFVSLSGYSSQPEMVYVTRIPALIGRGDMADCRLHGESISRVHAKLAYADANFILEDIESTNGTCVNDYPLKKGYPVLLFPGDEVSFGSERYEFRVC